MTLAEVAERIRVDIKLGVSLGQSHDARVMEGVVRIFEADPDFTLRDRVEALAAEEDAECLRVHGGHTEAFRGICDYQDRAARLRKLLEAKQP